MAGHDRRASPVIRPDSGASERPDAAGGGFARTYDSRIDAWAVLPLVGLLVAVSAGIITSVPYLNPVTGPVLVVLASVAVGLPLWTLLGTWYRIDDDWLHVRSGPFRWCIALREIRSVEPTRSARSGPALSLDRLRIRYGRNRTLLISPREKEAFLRHLGRCAGQRPAQAVQGGNDVSRHGEE